MNDDKDIGIKISNDIANNSGGIRNIINLLNKTNTILTKISNTDYFDNMEKQLDITSKSIQRFVNSSKELEHIRVSFEKILPAVSSFTKKFKDLSLPSETLNEIFKVSQSLNRFKMVAVELNKGDFKVDFSKIITGTKDFTESFSKIDKVKDTYSELSNLARNMNKMVNFSNKLKDIEEIDFSKMNIGIKKFIDEIYKIDNLKGKIELLEKLANSLEKIKKNTNINTKKINAKLPATNELKQINSRLQAQNLIAWSRILIKVFKSMNEASRESSGYIENLNLMQVAFKETRDSAEGFVSSMADIFGLDESAMTRQLGFYKQIGNSLDIADDKAQLLSKNLLKMQLDMASLYNLDFERAGSVIQASLAGQTKPIRGATGADITQASLQIDATNYGIDRQVKNLSRAEKVILIYLSLQRQLSESNGDLSATINTVANQQKIFTEQTVRLSRAFGNLAYPILVKILPVINGIAMVLTELINMLAVFIGFEVPEFDEKRYAGFEDFNGILGDTNDNLDKIANKVRSLRGFDKLNVINTPQNGGYGGGAGGALGGVDPRLLEAINEYDLKLSDIKNNATIVRDRIMEWLGFTKLVDEETGKVSWKLNDGYTNLEKIRDIAILIGTIFIGTKIAKFIKKLITAKEKLDSISKIATTLKNSALFKTGLVISIGIAGGALLADSIQKGKIAPKVNEIIAESMGAEYEEGNFVKKVLINLELIFANLAVGMFKMVGISEDDAINFLTNLGDLILVGTPQWQKAWGDVWDISLREYKKMWDNLIEWISDTAVGKFLINLGGLILFNPEKWGELWDVVKEGLKIAWQNSIDWLSDTAVGKFLINLGGLILFDDQTWSDLWSCIKTGLQNGWDSAVEWWNNTALVKWWRENVEPWFTWKKWHDLADNAVKGIGDAFSNFKIHLKMPHFKWHLEPIDGIIGDVLRALSLPAKMPKLNVNWYANGGFPNKGDLFIANEKNPEWVGSLGGKPAVANKGQMEEGIRKASRDGFLDAMQMTGGNKQNVYGRFQIDGGTFSDWIKMQDENRELQFAD